MDAFLTHKEIMEDYKKFLRSFINIKDPRIDKYVREKTLTEDILPEPLIQFNPSYEQGESFEQLISQGILDPKVSKAMGQFRLYRHQVEAIKIGIQNKGFVVTSGTGSGKSLTYLATIFNDLFKMGDDKPLGVKAILVYPMNALINSQFNEIDKYAKSYGVDFPITFAQYTGQESEDKKEDVRKLNPDIILTNYMMLELIMTRQSENWLRQAIKEHLKFLVFDELHTYRGRQGADISMLIRRIKNMAQQDLVTIGTSATMASKGTSEEKKTKIAEVAKIIFGTDYCNQQIIQEYLKPSTDGTQVTPPELKEAIGKGVNSEWDETVFIHHPLANWVEMNIALSDNNGTLERGIPKTLSQITEKIKSLTDLNADTIEESLKNLLVWAEIINEENRKKGTGKTFLPYRFHQFISQTGSISVTLESREKRFITSSNTPTAMAGGEEKDLYPLLFSRYTGYDFLKVGLDFSENKLVSGNLIEDFKNPPEAKTLENLNNGYIILDEGEDFWETEFEDLVPDNWRNPKGNKLKKEYSFVLPNRIYFDEKGNFSLEKKDGLNLKGYYLPTPLRIDPTALIIYEDPRTKDNTKLAKLGSEGRSTATSILSYSIINSLARQDEPLRDQKLLSFTDNRQDASLQAGHFNDFYTSIRLRSALYQAVLNNRAPLGIDEVTGAVFEILKLKGKDYARKPAEIPEFEDEENIKAVRKLLFYRIIQDLKRGWRYTMPNLEQTGLILIDYKNLKKLAGSSDLFSSIDLLEDLGEDGRYNILRNILDYFRTNLAIHHHFFEKRADNEELMKSRLDENKPWSLGEGENIENPRYMTMKQIKGNNRSLYTASIGSQSGLARYLRRVRQNHQLSRLSKTDYENWLNKILEVLRKTNFILAEENRHFPDSTFYRLNGDLITWNKNPNPLKPNELRVNTGDDLLEIQPNPYFVSLYQSNLGQIKKELIAKEHTGQIGTEERVDREKKFREGVIPILYCSPTMELGIDIANLNIVHMRNVPPNPANYAQRSGRAGRSGQTALVFTYCSAGSPHDVHYFKNSTELVAGTVVPPRIDLTNEELILSHLNAFLLMKSGLSELKTSAADVLDIDAQDRISIKPSVKETLESEIAGRSVQRSEEFLKILKQLPIDLKEIPWFSDIWLQQNIRDFPEAFKQSFERWKIMYQNACNLRAHAQNIIDNPTYKAKSSERNSAVRDEAIARKQIEKLTKPLNGNSLDSEFYVFRYLAAEGLLPGYNFTRLPVRVMLGKSYKDDVEVISRPRKLALSEFGPNNTVYHSGNKFRIKRMMVLDLENSLENLNVSAQTGYAFLNDESRTANVDPITGQALEGEKKIIYQQMLELSECEGNAIEKITSIEEERSRSGYEVHTYFNYPKGIENAQSIVLKKDGEKLLQLFFNRATLLISVNKKARRSNSDGFKINRSNGVWVNEKDFNENEEIRENTKEVYLFTRDTADTLYIQPLSNIGSNPEEIISLSYALKLGIERLFQVEENEIGVERMGNPEKPNILIYEASEGSLGVLSQLIADPVKMKEWFKESYVAIHFDPQTFEETEHGKTLPKASYEDLLSYYNQAYHKQLDRYAIKRVLEHLINCEIELVQGGKRDREEQYLYLLEKYDKNSSMELKFLKYLYENDYVLPDKAQVNTANYYISVDFIFENQGIQTLVFCDGSVHDNAEQEVEDHNKRTILENAGYDVIVWHYLEPLSDLMERRKDIFRRVR